ncbi:MAG: phosphoribosylamine--glycine ligase [Clostridia bacterium]|jgi:phosphoribosylamine--glycine ligase
MKVLVIGGGGREHAIVWKISKSPHVDQIFCAPGNGGISDIAECIDIKATDITRMVDFAVKERIDLIVVAPDDPLALGMVNALEEKGLRAFGPRKEAAILESSKVFAKDFMKRYNIPTAQYEVFDCPEKAKEYIHGCSYPIVIKADGLAFGKGVIIAQNKDEASKAIRDIMVDKVFKQAGNRIVIEEFLTGTEVSLLVFTDGKTYIPMVSAQDYKRVYDRDEGPNTGGMGSVSPNPMYTNEIAACVEEKIVKSTIDAMTAENRRFKGVLYFGLILTNEGPKLLEYNARFGDPETQVILPRLKTDLFEIMNAIIDEQLHEIEIQWEDNAAACVIAASAGYPGSYQTGFEIFGLNQLESSENVMVFHAGSRKEQGRYYTDGGRVLGVTALGSTLDQAINEAYQAISLISFDGIHYRKDIGKKDIGRLGG